MTYAFITLILSTYVLVALVLTLILKLDGEDWAMAIFGGCFFSGFLGLALCIGATYI